MLLSQQCLLWELFPSCQHLHLQKQLLLLCNNIYIHRFYNMIKSEDSTTINAVTRLLGVILNL